MIVHGRDNLFSIQPSPQKAITNDRPTRLRAPPPGRPQPIQGQGGIGQMPQMRPIAIAVSIEACSGPCQENAPKQKIGIPVQSEPEGSSVG